MKLSFIAFASLFTLADGFVIPANDRTNTALNVGWSLGKAPVDNRPVSDIKQELMELLPKMTGKKEELKKIEQLVNALEKSYPKAAAKAVKKEVIDDLKLPLDKMGTRYKAADGSIILGPSQKLSASVLAMAPLILAINPPGEFASTFLLGFYLLLLLGLLTCLAFYLPFIQ